MLVFRRLLPLSKTVMPLDLPDDRKAMDRLAILSGGHTAAFEDRL